MTKQTGPRTDINARELEDHVADHVASELRKRKASQGLSHAVGELLIGLDPDKLKLFVSPVTMLPQEMVRDPNMSCELRSCVVVGEVYAGLVILEDVNGAANELSRDVLDNVAKPQKHSDHLRERHVLGFG